MRHGLSRRSAARLDALGVRLRLSVRGVVALVAALAMLCVVVVGVAAVTDDVTEHNGLARSDLARLRWFTEHRSGALISFSKGLSDVGSVAVLGAIAVL